MVGLLDERVRDGVGHCRGAAVVGGDAGRVGDGHAPQVAQHDKRGERRDATQKERDQGRLPDRGDAVHLVLVGQFVAADEPDRHQKKDGDRKIQLFGNLDPAVDSRADDPEHETEWDRGEEVSLERLEDPSRLLSVEHGPQGHCRRNEKRHTRHLHGA
jgi:hypothetical protein